MARKEKADTKSVQLAPNKLIPFDDPRIPYPDMLGSWKLNGLRCFIKPNSPPLTRHMLVQPNKNLPAFLQELQDIADLEELCFDMELWNPKSTHLGSITSIFNAHDKPIPDGYQVHVFDAVKIREWDSGNITTPLHERVKLYQHLVNANTCNADRFVAVQQRLLKTPKDAEEMFAEAMEMDSDGHKGRIEGIMLRNRNGGYKQSRCGHKGAWLLKFKEEETVDGKIVEVIQQRKMKDGIDRERNAWGRLVNPTKNDDNYTTTDSVGCFRVIADDGKEVRVMFAAGLADAAKRKQWWKERKSLIGRRLEFKMYPGGKDSFLSGRMTDWRDDKDTAKDRAKRKA